MSEFRPSEHFIPAREKSVLLRKSLALGAAVTLLFHPAPAEAERASTGLCVADECNGLDPVEWGCSKDADTVASIEVMRMGSYEGQLELRYSPSCQSNWARFTTASGWRNSLRTSLEAPRPHGGRVTVWNPGKLSKGRAGFAFAGTAVTAYTYMVDGTKIACTGVEIYEGVRDPSGQVSAEESLGWSWGPCV